MGHTKETLEMQLVQIERLISECEGNPRLIRLLEHLKGRRETTVRAIERMKESNGSEETECDREQCADEPLCGV